MVSKRDLAQALLSSSEPSLRALGEETLLSIQNRAKRQRIQWPTRYDTKRNIRNRDINTQNEYCSKLRPQITTKTHLDMTIQNDNVCEEEKNINDAIDLKSESDTNTTNTTTDTTTSTSSSDIPLIEIARRRKYIQEIVEANADDCMVIVPDNDMESNVEDGSFNPSCDESSSSESVDYEDLVDENVDENHDTQKAIEFEKEVSLKARSKKFELMEMANKHKNPTWKECCLYLKDRSLIKIYTDIGDIYQGIFHKDKHIIMGEDTVEYKSIRSWKDMINKKIIKTTVILDDGTGNPCEYSYNDFLEIVCLKRLS
jgi:hypothetical protein